MEKKGVHPISISDDKGMLGKWNMLHSESISDEFEGTEPIVTTLYAKPRTGKPFLTLAKLKKGIYEETLYLSLKSYILFSDIGRAVWKAALEINRNSSIEFVRSSMLEEDKSWQVMIKNPDLTVLVNSVRFRPIGKYPSTFYNSIEISSKPATLQAFVKIMMEALNRKPWEDENGELDWGNFTKKSLMSRKEVIEQWALLSDLPELFTDSFKDTVKQLCNRCKLGMEKGWVFCPFCGEPFKEIL